MSIQILTQALLKEFIKYTPETGVFTWVKKTSPLSRIHIGNIAGTINKQTGYIYFNLFGKNYYCHRLAFLYITGEFPLHEVDHINGIKNDNVFSNLRMATKSQNMQNVKIKNNNTSGVTGVKYDKSRDAWIARIEVGKKLIFLKQSKVFSEAVSARKEAEFKYFGIFAYSNQYLA